MESGEGIERRDAGNGLGRDLLLHVESGEGIESVFCLAQRKRLGDSVESGEGIERCDGRGRRGSRRELVESGEGIERQFPRARLIARSVSVVESGEGIERGSREGECDRDGCAWNPVKELKDSYPNNCVIY